MLGAAVIDLELALNSQKERMTADEARLLFRCKEKARNHFLSGAFLGGGVGWAATSMLGKLARVNIAGGAGICFGFWRFCNCLDSCVDHILGLNGSRVQRELANILVKKYRDDPWTMKLMYRHFYSEQVFDDSNLDKPFSRWRYRNSFSDNVDYGQGTHDSGSHGDVKNDIDSVKAQGLSKHIPMNLGAQVMEDPFDAIFGFTRPVEEICHSSSSSTPTRVLTRSQKRSQRRHQRHHRESSSEFKHGPPGHI